MNRSAARLAALILVAPIVQQAVFAQFTMFGVHPDAVLAVVLCVAIAGGSQRGAITGFTAGLLHDVFLTTPLGTLALAYAVTGFVVGSISDGADELLWVSAALAAFGSVLAVGVYVAVGNVVSLAGVSIGTFVRTAIVIALVNALVVPLLARRLRFSDPIRREVAW